VLLDDLLPSRESVASAHRKDWQIERGYTALRIGAGEGRMQRIFRVSSVYLIPAPLRSMSEVLRIAIMSFWTSLESA
jgi:hypothetical protein